MATNVNYEDERFAEVESAKDAALGEVEATFNGMTDNADRIYRQMADAAQQYADTQSRLQQERTDFTIEQIEQQKEQAHKDYTKEQSGAYVDWQKQSNQYGTNAEQMAASGMSGTGYSESSQVSMYNTYQNRVATARESYNHAVLNYNNAIKDAQLQNNAALAEIAYNALQTQLSLSLEGFQYKNSLIMAESEAKMSVDNNYYGRYQDVLAQINQENAFAEQKRQFNASLAEQQRQFREQLAAQNGSLSGVEGEETKGNGVEATPNKDTSAYHTTKTGFAGTNRNSAVSYMKRNGVPDEVANKVMTEAAWEKSGDTKNKTYKDYLAKYVDYYSAAGKGAVRTEELTTTMNNNTGYVSPTVDGLLSALAKNEENKGKIVTPDDLKRAFSTLDRGQATNKVVEKAIDELYAAWNNYSYSSGDYKKYPTLAELLMISSNMAK